MKVIVDVAYDDGLLKELADRGLKGEITRRPAGDAPGIEATIEGPADTLKEWLDENGYDDSCQVLER